MTNAFIRSHLMCQMTPSEFSQRALVTSPIASERYRGGILTAVDKLNGASVTWTGGDVIDPSVDLLVIGKPPMGDEAELGRWAHSINNLPASTKVVLDYTDHHLVGGAHDYRANFYRCISGSIDLAVCPTEVLGEMLGESLGPAWQHGVPTRVVGDPIEFPFAHPRDSGRKGIETIGFWFGHSTNIQYLDDFLSHHTADFAGRKIVVVTAASYLAKNDIPLNTWLNHPSGARWVALPWSIEMIQEASQLCDYALLPIDPYDPKKNGASPNRLVNSLTLGLPTIATPMGSNSNLEDYFFSTDDEAGWRVLIQEPREGHDKVLAFRDTGSVPFTKEALIDKWRSLLTDLILD